jgi:hypothetical protein
VPVPTGRVTGVRLILANSPELDIGVQTFNVRCPSCMESGIKIVTHDLVVTKGGTLHLTIDFDLGASLVQEGSGFLLKPVIHVTGHPQELVGAGN